MSRTGLHAHALRGLDPLAIKWHCREAPAAWPAVCVPSSGSGDWYDLVSNAQDQFGWFRPPPIRDAATGKVKPAFLVARAGEKQASPWLPTLAFMDSFDWRGATRSCEALFPDRGMIEFRLDLPRTAADENPPNRILLHVGGPLGGTRLARCIAEAFETASGRFTVPASEKGSVMYFQVRFPLDATALEKKTPQPARVRRSRAPDRPVVRFAELLVKRKGNDELAIGSRTGWRPRIGGASRGRGRGLGSGGAARGRHRGRVAICARRTGDRPSP